MNTSSEIRGILIRETEKARLVCVAGRDVWIPKSITGDVTKFMPAADGTRECVLEVEDWFLNKENL